MHTGLLFISKCSVDVAEFPVMPAPIVFPVHCVCAPIGVGEGRSGRRALTWVTQYRCFHRRGGAPVVSWPEQKEKITRLN